MTIKSRVKKKSMDLIKQFVYKAQKANERDANVVVDVIYAADAADRHTSHHEQNESTIESI